MPALSAPEASADGSTPRSDSFTVGEWLIEPDLCRASRDGIAVHLRPQLMDLLVYLARQTGRTVPQVEILAAIWPGQQFLASTSLPRCVAELRQALGDRAGDPDIIMTVHKRGYRLIAPVRPAGQPGWDDAPMPAAAPHR